MVKHERTERPVDPDEVSKAVNEYAGLSDEKKRAYMRSITQKFGLPFCLALSERVGFESMKNASKKVKNIKNE